MILYQCMVAIIIIGGAVGLLQARDDEVCAYDTTVEECRCNKQALTRVIHVDASESCPSGWRVYTTGEYRLNTPACGGAWPTGCVSLTYIPTGSSYSRVCGRVIAYQWRQPNAFHGLVSGAKTTT